MACLSCSTDNGKPGGCGGGGCASGGCNRMNSYDWLSPMGIQEPNQFEIVEVSFKNGSRKEFYYNLPYTRAITGDTVVLETNSGYDVGIISLSGELVRLQMKKKRVNEDNVFNKVLRIANKRDIERLQEARSQEKKTMVKARVITRTLGLEMKIGDVEYRGDKRKATFYYTADGRVDFRELIRHFAKEFRVKIEMRQIGARQESARIGGLGSCGRELCCSTWLSDFKSVSTAAARYQNLAINQAKLSGQCGRLKCCLNYELDSYVDALGKFPKKADTLKTEAGIASLVKTDIFKGIMYYAYVKNGVRGKFYPLPVSRVQEILAANKAGETPLELMDSSFLAAGNMEQEMDYGDVTGVIELPPEERRKKKRRRNRNKNKNRNQKPDGRPPRNNKPNAAKDQKSDKPSWDDKPGDRKPEQKSPERKPGDKKPSNRTQGDRKPGSRRPGRGGNRRSGANKPKDGSKPNPQTPKGDGAAANPAAPKPNRSKRRRPKRKPRPKNKNGNNSNNNSNNNNSNKE